ncbi:hypothetical protein BU26DRAFT_218363 [Trematosphaeria pertusa]|uniref:Uncharacterized protein n=1 Tax=Trematosphaeria pertusa TaxID=390896 RepID=A0A6A6IS56_9PLEO|nr:uncharacterized protein BU26DRAFT_218363 [Trematosphaeria pertusa]KAF2253226.1 hypothetical protein BU26DRAFT_218363 [Trematosphaeria pertusa]
MTMAASVSGDRVLEPGQMAGCGLRTLKGVSSSQRHLWDDPLARVSALNSLFPSAPYSDLKLAKYRRLSMTSLSPPERRGSVNPLIGHHLLEHVEIPVELAKRSPHCSNSSADPNRSNRVDRVGCVPRYIRQTSRKTFQRGMCQDTATSILNTSLTTPYSAPNGYRRHHPTLRLISCTTPLDPSAEEVPVLEERMLGPRRSITLRKLSETPSMASAEA